MDEKGVFKPSRTVTNSNIEPSGVNVMPGAYKLVIHYQSVKDSAMINVAYDPRIPVSEEVLQKQYDLLKELEKKMDLTYRAAERLKDSKTIVDNIKKQASKVDKETYKDLIKSSDSINKIIDGLIDDMLGKEDKRQGITATKVPSTISYLNDAISYVSSLRSEPGATELRLIENANTKIDPVMMKINDFYQTEWSDYRKLVENAKLSLFKDYKPLK
jgi:hypothetical protein